MGQATGPMTCPISRTFKVLGARAARADLFENKMGKYRCITKFMNRLYGVMAVEHYERTADPFYAIQAS